MALIVQKYGGTSVGDLNRIRNVAHRVARTRQEGNRVVVVVSAMSGETDRLIQLAHQASDNPELREYDSLISTGEQVSAALLAITLQSLGVPAKSFLGPQLRIVTDSAFSTARIQKVEGSAHLARASPWAPDARRAAWDSLRRRKLPSRTTLGR